MSSLLLTVLHVLVKEHRDKTVILQEILATLSLFRLAQLDSQALSGAQEENGVNQENEKDVYMSYENFKP